MSPQLIFDVGMHVGDDTAYYLSKGYRVVAIEANPQLVQQAESRFNEQIANGSLILENCVITTSDADHEVDFWICNEDSGLSSFDRNMAIRLGHTCHSVKIESSQLSTLVAKHGIPYYLKIDIEGLDHMAISDLPEEACPNYVSMEISSIEDFLLLKEKGYKQFKCIQQGSFSAISAIPISIRQAVSHGLQSIKSSPAANFIRNSLRRRGFTQPSSSKASTENWRFSLHSSGPFAEETAGAWLTFEQVLHAWLDYKYKNILGYDTWFDLHAKRH